jgi:hypothetical protein
MAGRAAAASKACEKARSAGVGVSQGEMRSRGSGGTFLVLFLCPWGPGASEAACTCSMQHQARHPTRVRAQEHTSMKRCVWLYRDAVARSPPCLSKSPESSSHPGLISVVACLCVNSCLLLSRLPSACFCGGVSGRSLCLCRQCVARLHGEHTRHCIAWQHRRAGGRLCRRSKRCPRASAAESTKCLHVPTSVRTAPRQNMPYFGICSAETSARSATARAITASAAPCCRSCPRPP